MGREEDEDDDEDQSKMSVEELLEMLDAKKYKLTGVEEYLTSDWTEKRNSKLIK